MTRALGWITAAELYERLHRTGHHESGENSGSESGVEVWPSADTIVTVALDLDPTVYESYRQRYFACLLESEDNPVPVIAAEPEFAFRGPLEGIAAEHPEPHRFITGPFRWLMNRLSRCLDILLWPAREAGRREGDGEVPTAELLGDCPGLHLRLRSARAAGIDVGGLLLDLTKSDDCLLLWEVAAALVRWDEDCYVADLECLEVYRMHHHAKVVISIPNEQARESLLADLYDLDAVLEDCSGYE